ncbi:DUF362 domain-containing protein [Isosphaeraceae bacterium EP7]
MDAKPRVALVRSDNRRGAIAQALTLVSDDLRRVASPEVLLKPNLVSHSRQGPSTHADALSATLDALFAAGSQRVTVAEGASDAAAGFERMGYLRETAGRPVSYFDINRDEDAWEMLDLVGVDGRTLRARVSRTIAGSSCRVSLALAKTHMIVPLTMTLKNMLSSIHPADRVMMHGYPAGQNGTKGWKRHIVNWLKRDDLLVNLATRTMGRGRNLVHAARRLDSIDGHTRLNGSERHFLKSVAAMQANLVALNHLVRPHFGVIDAFVGMHREGPRHGTPIRLGIAAAGADPVAVDAVVAASMGFDPMEIGYLRDADAAGLGVARLDAIEIVGDRLATVIRKCVPHSTHVIQRHVSSVVGRPVGAAGPALRGPHASGSRTLAGRPKESDA